MKAAFLYNFTKFVEWPADAFASKDAALVIGVLGENPFGSELEQVVKEKTVSGHPVVVRQSGKVEELLGAHLLFICRSEESRLAEILKTLETRSILTVGDAPDFAATGGVINFVLRDNKIRFEIGVVAAEKAKLKIGAQLLNLALPSSQAGGRGN